MPEIRPFGGAVFPAFSLLFRLAHKALRDKVL